MTRDEAVQEQINDIMDSFNFNETARMYEAVDWTLGGELPTEYDLRRATRSLLNDAAKSKCDMGSGGIYVVYREGNEYGEPWLRLNVHIGNHSINDGVLYEQ